ncbi:MAG: Clp protease [Hamadaea sp.]|nr:Clp protease [Hamadaea sp.]
MFERLTPQARNAITAAVQVAAESGADKAGPQHLLLAIASQGDGVTARVLADHGITAAELRRTLTTPRPVLSEGEITALRTVGIDAEEVLRRIEETFGPDALDPAPASTGKRRGLLGGPFDADGRKAIELSLREAIAIGKRTPIGTEHLLLGVLRTGVPEPLASLLTERGLTYDDTRRALLADTRPR